MKLLTIVGARPQFIKAAAVSRVLPEHDIDEVLVHTGQHFDRNMSEVFFQEMEIPIPNYNLDIHSLSHGAMTGRMLEAIEGVIVKENPDMVMVYGDTNSTIAGALAARKLHIPVAHVEAGLRSFNMAMPEEVNRVLTDRISDYLFCPTQAAVKNLEREGFNEMEAKIHNSGDVMQDAALYYGAKSEEKSDIIQRMSLSEPFVLATFHRQENTDSPQNLSAIIDGLNLVNSEVKVIVPMHPRTRKILGEVNDSPEFTVIDPVGYFDMIELIKHCSLVMTDSGGLQKEAFFFGKCCVTLRAETEWVELVEGGFNTLAWGNARTIFEAWQKMVEAKPNFSVNLYGNGEACDRIVRIIAR